MNWLRLWERWNYVDNGTLREFSFFFFFTFEYVTLRLALHLVTNFKIILNNLLNLNLLFLKKKRNQKRKPQIEMKIERPAQRDSIDRCSARLSLSMWDFILKNLNYFREYNTQSLDLIKRQFDVNWRSRLHLKMTLSLHFIIDDF